MNCRICAAPNLPIVDRYLGARTFAEIALFYCKKCDAAFTSPEPWDYADWHEKDIDAISYYSKREKVFRGFCISLEP